MTVQNQTSYIPMYKRYILRYYSHTKSRIRQGNILQVRYKGAPHNDNPHLLILNPNYEGLMHALVIDYLKPMQFIELLDHLNITYEPLPSRDSIYTARQILAKQNPYSMYHDTLKPLIKRYKIYRTYKVGNITNVTGVTLNIAQLLYDTNPYKEY